MLIDLYVTSQTPEEDGSGDPDARAERIRGKLGAIPRPVGRVAVAVRRPDGEGAAGRTGSPSAAGRTGSAGGGPDPARLHPLVAERLGVWRLSGSS